MLEDAEAAHYSNPSNRKTTDRHTKTPELLLSSTGSTNKFSERELGRSL